MSLNDEQTKILRNINKQEIRGFDIFIRHLQDISLEKKQLIMSHQNDTNDTLKHIKTKYINLKQELQQELKQEFKQELKQEIVQELKQQLTDELKQQLKQQIVQEFKQELKQQIVQELKQEIIQDVKDLRPVTPFHLKNLINK